jgi:plastocyanin
MRSLLLSVLAVLAPVWLAAQSLLYRAPNLGGTWVPDPGVVQFNFAHRFHVFPAPSHAVVNYPSFTLAVGPARHLAVGWRFGTHSLIQGVASSNESEFFARYRLGVPEGARGFALAVTPAYNALAKSLDGEVGLDWTGGPVTLQGAARLLQKPLGQSGAQAAFGGGIVARLNSYVAVSADVGSLVGPTTLAVWGAAIDFVIPGSPHTFSLQASNASLNTIQGNSRGTPERRYGFEFTIPLHLSRFGPWFHRTASAASPATAGPVAAEVVVESIRFWTDTVTIAAGQAVRWVNHDDVEHTVTFDAREAHRLSGPLRPRGQLVIRFDTPGVYTYYCDPHRAMRAVVVVR